MTINGLHWKSWHKRYRYSTTNTMSRCTSVLSKREEWMFYLESITNIVNKTCYTEFHLMCQQQQAQATHYRIFQCKQDKSKRHLIEKLIEIITKFNAEWKISKATTPQKIKRMRGSSLCRSRSRKLIREQWKCWLRQWKREKHIDREIVEQRNN